MGRMKEIAEELRKADTVHIFAHTNMDGDALGSSAALCHMLRREGKTAYVICEDKVAENLKFLDKGYCRDYTLVEEAADACICIDCHGEDRLSLRNDLFLSGRVQLCLDHHATVSAFDGPCVIDPKAAATGELIYELFEEMNYIPDEETADAIFAAITTDTGNFQYSNCTKRTHEIVTKLYDYGLDHNKVSINIYENIALVRIKLEAAVMNNAQFIADKKAVVASVSQKLLEETGTSMEDTEGIVASLRSIRGIEISAILKEKSENEIKVSMRAKQEADVARICEAFGGGGHIKAAGCTLNMTLEGAVSVISEAIEESLMRPSM